MPSIIIKSGIPPTADPEVLEVSPGEDFEFEAEKEDVAFTIKFTEDSPDKNNPDKKRKSSKSNGKNKIKMKAQDVKKRYPYEIVIGDSSGDPAIIIK